MTTYVYEADDGDQLELTFPMGEAPEDLVHEGRLYERIVVGGQGFVMRQVTSSDSFTGYGLPTREKLSPEERAHVDGWTETGHPCFDNRTNAEAFCAAGKRRVERTGEGTYYEVGVAGEDAPTGVEVAREAQQGRLMTE